MRRRRREPLHERLLRDAGAEVPPLTQPDLLARLAGAGIHGLQRLREWDTVVTVDAPDLPGDRAVFVTLPDRSFMLDAAAGELDPTPLADALEAELTPPYRAEALRREGTLWAVGARAIRVVELPEHLAGEELELSVRGDERTLVIDGFRTFARVPELETLAGGYRDYVVRAARLDDALWEVEVSPL